MQLYQKSKILVQFNFLYNSIYAHSNDFFLLNLKSE